MSIILNICHNQYLFVSVLLITWFTKFAKFSLWFPWSWKTWKCHFSGLKKSWKRIQSLKANYMSIINIQFLLNNVLARFCSCSTYVKLSLLASHSNVIYGQIIILSQLFSVNWSNWFTKYSKWFSGRSRLADPVSTAIDWKCPGRVMNYLLVSKSENLVLFCSKLCKSSLI